MIKIPKSQQASLAYLETIAPKNLWDSFQALLVYMPKLQQHALGVWSVLMTQSLMIGTSGMIKDTINMAIEFNKHIDISWSIRKWKEVHDSLAKKAAIKRLKEDNKVFDGSEVLKLLPKEVHNRVIRSSVRLALEGMHQGNCIGSGFYASAALKPHYAIMSVLADGKRVSLTIKAEDNKLVISEMKYKLNRSVPVDVSDSICKRLNASKEVYATQVDNRNNVVAMRKELLPEVLATCLPILREHKVEKLELGFTGSGDDGSFDSLDFYDKQGNYMREASSIQELPVNVPIVQIINGNATPIREDTTLEAALYDSIANYVQDRVQIDWYNNSGGGGRFTFYVTQEEAFLNAYFTSEEEVYGNEVTWNLNNPDLNETVNYD